MGHIFISYSHKDREYVHRLQEALQKEGFDVWIDDRIDYGSEWPKVIQDHLDTCDAFIVVVTQNAYESKWVQNEIARADRKQKPIFPLLLQGETWLSVEATQYVDVRDQSLPAAGFYQQLAEFTQPQPAPSPNLVTSGTGQANAPQTEVQENTLADHRSDERNRCHSITHTGRRCTRSVFLHGRYCWQHESPVIKWVKSISALGLFLTLIGLSADLIGIFDFLSTRRGADSPTEAATSIVAATPEPVPTGSPTTIPTPAGPICEFEPALENEVLVIITGFHGDKGDLTSKRIYEELFDRVSVEQFKDVRVERSDISTPQTAKQALEVGRACHATIVIWGTVDSIGVKARYEVIEYQRMIEIRPNFGEVTAADIDESGQPSSPVVSGTDQISNDPITFEAYIFSGVPNEYEYLLLFSLGQIAYFGYDYPKAISLFDEALSIDLGAREQELGRYIVYYYRGESNANLGKTDLALQDYNNAINLSFADTKLYLARGYAYEKKGEFKLALQDYKYAIGLCEQALNNNSNDANAYFQRAQIYLRIAASNRYGGYVDFYRYTSSAIEDLITAGELQPDNARIFFWLGEAYLELGNHNQEALESYEKAVSLDPTFIEAYVGIGATQANLENFEASSAAFDKAISLNPNYAAIYRNRAKVHTRMDKPDQALQDYTKAVTLNPSDFWSFHLRGNVYYGQERYEEARKDYERAIELNKLFSHSYIGIAYVSKARGDWEKALADFEVAIQVCSETPCLSYVYYYRGIVYKNNRNLNEALTDLQRAVSINPYYVSPHIQIAEIYDQQRREDLALVEYNKAMDICALTWCTSDRYNSRGFFLENTGKYEAAIADYTKAIETDPQYYVAYANRGAAYGDAGQFDRAIKDFDAAIRICRPRKNCAWLYNRRGNFFKDQGLSLAAEADYAAAISQDPEYFWPYSNRANLYLETFNDVELAVKEHELAIQVCERNKNCNDWAYYVRGNAYFQAKRWEDAIADYTSAIALDPWYYNAYVERGLAYYELDQYDLAVRDVRKAIQLDPEFAWAYYELGTMYRDLYKTSKNSSDKTLLIDNMVKAITIDNDYALTIIRDDAFDLFPHEIMEHAIALQPDHFELYRARAELYYDNGYKEQAVQDLNLMISLDPNNPQVYLSRGDFYRWTALDPETAILEFEKASNLDPFSYGRYGEYAYEILANNYANIGQKEQALRYYDSLIAANPQNLELLVRRAGFYENQLKDIESAIADYSRVIEVDPFYAIADGLDFSFAVEKRARLYHELREDQKALADYARLIELDPENPQFYARRALFYRDILKDPQNALQDLDEVIALDPAFQIQQWWHSYKYARMIRAEIHHELGQDQKALEDCARLIALDPQNPEYYAARATFYRNTLQDLDKALQDLDQIIEIDPLREISMNGIGGQALTVRAQLYHEMDQDQKALADYAHLIALDPQNPEYYMERAIFYRDVLKDPGKALEDFTRVIEIDPLYYYIAWDSQFALLMRAQLYHDLSDDQEALADYGRWIELDPQNPEHYAKRAVFYLNVLEDRARAVEDLSRIIELDPGFSSQFASYGYKHALIVRAQLYDGLGDNEKALADYARLIELNPRDVNHYAERAFFYRDSLSDLHKAVEDLTRIVEIDPEAYLPEYGNDYALVVRARLYHELGEDEKALADYARLIELHPEKPEYYVKRANFYGGTLQELGKALEDLNKAVDLETASGRLRSVTDDHPLLLRAQLYHDLGDDQKALADYSRLIQLHPQNPEIYAKRAIFSIETLKDPSRAVEDLSKIIELDPGFQFNFSSQSYEYALVVRAGLYHQLGDDEKALADYDRLIELYPKGVHFYARRVVFALDTLEDLEQAVADLEEIIEQDPAYQYDFSSYGYEYALVVRAKLYHELGNDEKALADYARLIELDPENPDYHIRKALFCRDTLKDLDQAAQSLDGIIRVDPFYQISVSVMSGTALTVQAQLYHELGNDEKALAAYARLIELEPESPASYAERALFYRDTLKDPQKALEDFGTVIDLDPTFKIHTRLGDKYARMLRADLYHELNQDKSALADYSQWIELDPDDPEGYAKRAVFYLRTLQDKKHAIEDLSKVIEIEPTFQIELSPQASEYALIVRANLYHELGEEGKALADYGRLIRLDPKNPEYYAKRVIFHYDTLHDLNKALEDLSKIVELDPLFRPYLGSYGYEYPLVVRAKLCHQLGDDQKALADYARLIELDPDEPAYYAERALFYRDALQDVDKALKDFNMVISLTPLYQLPAGEYALLLRAQLFYQNKMKALADADVDKLILLSHKIGPGSSDYFMLRANYYQYSLKDLEVAAQEYTHAIEVSKGKDERPFIGRGTVYHDTRDYDAAFDDFSTAIQLNPENYEGFLHRGNINRIRGDLQAAMQDYDRAIELKPDDAFCYAMRSMGHYALEAFEAALSDAEKAIELGGNWNWFFEHRADIYQAVGEYEKAIEDYSLALEAYPSDVWLYVARGYVYTRVNNFPAAIDDFTAALAIQPGHYEALTQRAYTFHLVGKHDLAIDDYTSAIAVAPNISLPYFRRAECYEYIGKLEAAVSDYTLAIKIEPRNPQYYLGRSHTYRLRQSYWQATIDYLFYLHYSRKLAAVFAGIFFLTVVTILRRWYRRRLAAR